MVVPAAGPIRPEQVRSVLLSPAGRLGRHELTLGQRLGWRQVKGLDLAVADQLGRLAVREVTVLVEAVRI